jgi:hypothetical protein
MQNRKQRRVDDQGLGFSYQLAQDSAPQGLKVAPEVAYSPMQRGGMKTHRSGEQVTEETPNLAQERTLGLNTSKLLEEGKRYDLRVRELLESLVASPFRVPLGPADSRWSSTRQNKMVTASSKRANCGVSSGRVI